MDESPRASPNFLTITEPIFFQASFATYSFCGTAEYVAPEVVLKTGHGKNTDLWALGGLVFELVEVRNLEFGKGNVSIFRIPRVDHLS